MKKCVYLYSFLVLLLFSGCEKTENKLFAEPEFQPENVPDIPEGYFIATFFGLNPGTRAAISGTDTRVQSVRYILYQSTGEFVKERIILSPGSTPSWPLPIVRDTLPKGQYKAVFLANVKKELFPYSVNSQVSYNEVLENYKTGYLNARIYLPNVEFSPTTEYYIAKADFSDQNATPVILLQRMISLFNVHRNFVDAQTALNSLVNNIVTQVKYKDILQTTAKGLLDTNLRLIAGLGDALINPIIDILLVPVTDALYQLLLKGLVNQLGLALTGNEDQQGLLTLLGVLLNPWEGDEAHTAIVTINNFPKAVDFNLTVQEYYLGSQKFRFDFTNNDPTRQKSLDLKGFSGMFDIRNINVIKKGLVSGLVVDQTIDGALLLNGAFVDITDPIQCTPGVNLRYKSDYSFLDLGLKDYTQQTDGNHNLTLILKLGDVANIDSLLGTIPLLGTLLSSLIKEITLEVPLNLPLLGIDNLTLSGSWSAPITY